MNFDGNHVDAEEITVPSGVECIRYDAFYEASHLTGISLPGSLTEIGGYAFQECYNLTGVTIPAGVTKIGTNPFAEYHHSGQCNFHR